MNMLILEERILFDAGAAADAAEAQSQQQDAGENTPDQSTQTGSDDGKCTAPQSGDEGADASPSGNHQDATPSGTAKESVTESIENLLASDSAAEDDGDHADNATEEFTDGLMNTQPQSAVGTGRNVILVDENDVNAAEIAENASENTIVIRYDAQNISAEELIALISDSLKGEKIDCLGVAVPSDTNGNTDILKNDSDASFWSSITSYMSENGRIDFMGSGMADGSYVNTVGNLTGLQVAASSNITGSGGDWILETGNIDLRNVYFNGQEFLNITFSVTEAAESHELAVINPSVMDAEKILDDLGENVDVLVLDNDSDPLEQMNDYLDSRNMQYDAIHIISHGDSGFFVLNGRIIDNDYADQHKAGLAELGSHMTADGDLMIYGCSLADGEAGQMLVAKLAEYTGADVAASKDTTSNSGGNWQLEYTSGTVTTDSFTIEGYDYRLAVHTVTSNMDDGSANTLRYEIDNALSGDEIIFTLDNGFESIKINSQIEITKTLSINGDNSGGSGTQVTVQATEPGVTQCRVFYINAPSETVDMTNLTVCGGNISALGTEGNDSLNNGAGIFNAAGTVNLTNVTISNGIALDVGAVYNLGTMTLDGCSITDNTATSYYSAIHNSGNMTLSGCEILRNQAGSNGGAVGNIGTLDMTDCIVSYNDSALGGGVMNTGDGVMTITDCEFTHNSAFLGGAIHNQGSTMTITGCTFTANEGYAGAGGAICNASETYVIDCEFTGNTSGQHGGAIYTYNYMELENCTFSDNETNNCGGAVCASGTIKLTDCTINGGSGSYGGGLYSEGTAYLTGCTISGATATYGGGLFNEGTMYLTNTTVSDNKATVDGGGIYNNLNGAAKGVLTALDSTITGNSAVTGTGIYNCWQLYMSNSIVAYNYTKTGTLNNDFACDAGSTAFGNYNITGPSWTGIGGSAENNNISDYTAPNIGEPNNIFANFVTVNGYIVPELADNGGYTFTVALSAESVALLHGTKTGSYEQGSLFTYWDKTASCWKSMDGTTIIDPDAVTRITVDQRGMPRSLSDIGAYQLTAALKYKTAADSSWNTLATWKIWDGTQWINAEEIPNAENASTVSILNAVNIDIDLSINQTIVESEGALVIDAGKTLTITDGTGTDLEVKGQIANNGIFICESGSDVLYSGSGDQLIAAGTYCNLTLSEAGTKTLAGSITVNGNWTNNTAFDHADQTVIFGGDSIILSNGYAFHDIQFNGNSVSLADELTAHDISINNGILHVEHRTITLSGDLSVGNTTEFHTTECTLIFNGTHQTVSSTLPVLNFCHVVAETDHKTLVFTVDTVMDTLDISSGTVDIGTHTLTINVAITGDSSNLNASQGTVKYMGDADQNIVVTQYCNLVLGGSGTKTLAGDVSVSGAFTVQNVIFNADGFSFTFNGTGLQSVSSSNNLEFYSITISNSSGISLSGAAFTTGSVSFTNGSIRLADSDLTVNGDVSGARSTALFITDGTGCLFRPIGSEFFLGTGARYVGLSVTGASTGIIGLRTANGINGSDMSQLCYNMTFYTDTSDYHGSYTMRGIVFDPSAASSQFQTGNYHLMRYGSGWSSVRNVTGDGVFAFSSPQTAPPWNSDEDKLNKPTSDSKTGEMQGQGKSPFEITLFELDSIEDQGFMQEAGNQFSNENYLFMSSVHPLFTNDLQNALDEFRNMAM